MILAGYQSKIYEGTGVRGPDTFSLIACVSKISWEQTLKEGNLNKKLKSAKTPVNCHCLNIKRTNLEIWADLSVNHRSNDRKTEEIQNVLPGSSSLLLQAASELNQHFPTSKKQISLTWI